MFRICQLIVRLMQRSILAFARCMICRLHVFHACPREGCGRSTTRMLPASTGRIFRGRVGSVKSPASSCNQFSRASYPMVPHMVVLLTCLYYEYCGCSGSGRLRHAMNTGCHFVCLLLKLRLKYRLRSVLYHNTIANTGPAVVQWCSGARGFVTIYLVTGLFLYRFPGFIVNTPAESSHTTSTADFF